MNKKIKYTLIVLVLLFVCWLVFLFIAGLNGIYPTPN